MRVMVSHTGSVQANCAAALREHAPEAEYVDTSASETAYAQEIARYWDASDDLVIIEHDNEITADVLPGFAACREPWCTFGYEVFAPPWTRLCETGIGCVRFTPEFQRAMDFRSYVLAGACEACGELHNHWGMLDARITMGAQQAGIKVHVHGEIRHFHPYQAVVPGTRGQTAPAVDVVGGFRRVTG